jgi:hypothetical protein
MRRHRAGTRQLTVATLPGIGRTYEMTDLDGDRVCLVVLRGGGSHLLIWPDGDNAPAAIAALDGQQARQLAFALLDVGSPSDVDVTAPYQSRPDRLLSHAGTPLPPADPRPLRQFTGSVCDDRSADARDIDRLPHRPPVAVDPHPAVLAAARRRHPSSMVTSEASAVDPPPPAVFPRDAFRGESGLESSTHTCSKNC